MKIIGDLQSKFTAIYDNADERNTDVNQRCKYEGYICTKICNDADNRLIAIFEKKQEE